MSNAVSGEGREHEEEDASIYLRVRMGAARCDWYVIKTNSITPSEDGKPVPPVFAPEPDCLSFSACVAVGSIIYSLGGVEPPRDLAPPSSPRDLARRPVFKFKPPLADVYYIDTNSPEGGWKKLPYSMNTPRAYSAHAFTTNDKIYVVGGSIHRVPYMFASTPTPMPEVFDTLNQESGWRMLVDPPDVPGSNIVGHGVIDGGKRVVVHSCYDPHLYCYDVAADSWKLLRENILGYKATTSATVDGVFYFLDDKKPGAMFGIQVDNCSTMMQPMKVVLTGSPEDYDWMPQPGYAEEDYMPAEAHFIAVGNGKLAVVYDHHFFNFRNGRHVCCSTFKMCKVNNERGELGFVAYPLHRSGFAVCGKDLVDCIAVFPSQTRGPQEGISKGDNAISAPKEVRKEGNTISAEEDVSMEDNTIAAEEDVSVGENTISAPEDGGSDINKKRRKLGENAAE
ncbi:hypothetical protein RHGRI_023334 [Rhododendron griersonianum]|uniref:Uncharacterized protein n=1 Tax=Rhododendron griersonianum TaxID=479676 RepID=A0AAV6J379_9ERIC|nr:hypothetical protein RHGRI_023334 [Rhododendron griersonianum]